MFGRNGLGRAVDRGHLVAFVECDAVIDIPAVTVNDDFLELLLARQDGRQHDPVVVDARLGVEDRDVVTVGRRFEQALQSAAGRHAVTDDDQLLFAILLVMHQATLASS